MYFLNKREVPVIINFYKQTLNKFYLVYICALMSLHQVNTDKFTHIRVLLNHCCINTIRNSNVFQPLKGHLQGI